MTPGTKPEKVLLLGFVTSLNIVQSKNSAYSVMKVAVSIDITGSKYLGSDLGVVFAIKFGHSPKNAIRDYYSETCWGGSSQQQIKHLGTIVVNHETYDYYLVYVTRTSSYTVALDLEFDFQTTNLANMSFDAYSGFMFSGITQARYNAANTTTNFHFPHYGSFDKHKFIDALTGDILIAGVKENEGIINIDYSLKIEL